MVRLPFQKGLIQKEMNLLPKGAFFFSFGADLLFKRRDIQESEQEVTKIDSLVKMAEMSPRTSSYLKIENVYQYIASM